MTGTKLYGHYEVKMKNQKFPKTATHRRLLHFWGFKSSFTCLKSRESGETGYPLLPTDI
jgi:hypothetical protein